VSTSAFHHGGTERTETFLGCPAAAGAPVEARHASDSGDARKRLLRYLRSSVVTRSCDAREAPLSARSASIQRCASRVHKRVSPRRNGANGDVPGLSRCGLRSGGSPAVACPQERFTTEERS
jgi:hypothetical protein